LQNSRASASAASMARRTRWASSSSAAPPYGTPPSRSLRWAPARVCACMGGCGVYGEARGPQPRVGRRMPRITVSSSGPYASACPTIAGAVRGCREEGGGAGLRHRAPRLRVLPRRGELPRHTSRVNIAAHLPSRPTAIPHWPQPSIPTTMTSTTSVARLQGDIDMTTGEARGEEKHPACLN